MRRILASMAAAALLAGIVAGPATAITDGEPDGDGHPYVGLMVAQDAAGNPMWRCTGTLVSPTLYLTAGHCTFGAAHVEIWFVADVDAGRPGNGYPFDGEVGGMPYTHPQYDNAAFNRFDLGLVVLDAPMVMDQYGALPGLDSLDAMTPSSSAVFTAVGYGLQKAFPDAAGWKTVANRVRLVAQPHLVQINTGLTGDGSLVLSNNANTGGTCFGDSGGPNFVGSSSVIGGVTSFGLNGTCGGTGGVYRVDRSDDLTWLATFGLTP